MIRSAPPQQKLTWLLIIFAFASVVVMLTVVAETLPARTERATVTSNVLTAVAMICLLASSGIAMLGIKPRARVGEQPRPIPVQTLRSRTLLALAIGEVCTLVGFVLKAGNQAATMVPYGIGTLIVYGLVILPSGLAQWKLIEEREQA